MDMNDDSYFTGLQFSYASIISSFMALLYFWQIPSWGLDLSWNRQGYLHGNFPIDFCLQDYSYYIASHIQETTHETQELKVIDMWHVTWYEYLMKASSFYFYGWDDKIHWLDPS